MIFETPASIVILYFIIGFFSLVVLFVFSAVIIRRIYKERYYKSLDFEREQYAPLVNSLITSTGSIDKHLIKGKVNSVAWVAVEELLLKAADNATSGQAAGDQAADERMVRIGECFESLGIIDQYLLDLRSGKKFRAPLSAERLGRVRAKRAVGDLIDALKNRERDVKNMAVNSLGLIGDESAIEPLIDIFKDAVDNNEDISIRIIKNALLSFGPSAVPYLLKDVSSSAWRVRSKVLDVLCEMDDPELKGVFLQALKDTEPDVRAKGAKGLGRLKDAQGTLEPLIKLISDESWVVRFQSVTALGLLGSDGSIDAFKQAISDSNWQVRRASAEALGKLGLKSVKEFADVMLRSEDRYAREQVAEELQRSGLIYAFIENLRDPERCKTSEDILFDVGRNGVVSPLIDAMDDKDPVMRAKVAALLGRIGNFRARDILQRTAKIDNDSSVREAAEKALRLVPIEDPHVEPSREKTADTEAA
jgi:HEAT repeat protein